MQDIEEKPFVNDRLTTNLLREDTTVNDAIEGRSTNSIKEAEPSNFELVKQHLKIAFPAFIAGSPVQISILTMIIASYFDDSEKVAGLGLGSSTLILCVYLVLFGIS